MFGRATSRRRTFSCTKASVIGILVLRHTSAEHVGPIVRIAPNQYSIDDPDATKIIYGHSTKFIKVSPASVHRLRATNVYEAPWYQASGAKGITELFTDSNQQRHADNRRKVANLYSMSTLVQFEPMVEQCTSLFATRLGEFASSGRSFDLQHWLQCYAFDVIGSITLNKRFGFLDQGEDIRGILHSIHSYLVYAANVGIYAEWHDTIRAIQRKLIPNNDSEGILAFTQQELAERGQASDHKEEGNQFDFLTKTLKLHQDAPERFTMMHVITTCLNNIGAGSDTTSVSLASIVHNLMKSPDKLNKLRQELDEAAANGRASTPITFQQAQALPYLQACIKEGLRLHPATGLPLARVVPPEGATIAGTFFPGSTIVGINTWVAHYNQSVFGPDADTFRPERWLESKEKVSRMDQYYFPFGLGSRTCIGKNISLMEMSKLIPELVRQFDLRLVHPERKLETVNVWFVKQTNLECSVALREK